MKKETKFEIHSEELDPLTFVSQDKQPKTLDKT